MKEAVIMSGKEQTIVEQVRAIRTALVAINDYWELNPAVADYTIKFEIAGRLYPLNINPIDIGGSIMYELDELESIAKENEW